jgi:hypothetical protein
MSEEDINPSYDTEETETSGSGYEKENNTSNVSEDANTQETGPRKETAKDRIEQLAREKNEWKEKYEALTKADKPSSGKQVTSDDKLKRIELEIKAPSHLENRIDEMTEFWKANPNLSKSQVYTLFDDTLVPKSQIDEYKFAESEANSSRTGGTANPTTRSDTPDLSKAKDEELDELFQQRLQAGDTF